MRRELEGLPKAIEAAEEEQAKVGDALSDPATYRGDKARVVELQQRHNTLRDDLEQKYARWEELETRAEASGQSS